MRSSLDEMRSRAEQLPEGERQAALGKIDAISEQLESLHENVSAADSPETVESMNGWKADLASQMDQVESTLPAKAAPTAGEPVVEETEPEPAPEEHTEESQDEGVTDWEDVNPTDQKDWHKTDPNWKTGPFKEAIEGLSGKEAATDIPGWAEGARPYVGENGDAFARRILRNRYPERPESTFERGARSDWSRLQKYVRGYRDPE